MLQTAENPGLTGQLIVMDVSELSISPNDEYVTECGRARRAITARDVQRLSDVFIAGISEGNDDLLPHYSQALSSMRKKLAMTASMNDRDMVERMIDRVHERYVGDSRQSIISRLNSVFIENTRIVVPMSDDAWLAARRHSLAYDTSETIENLTEALKPGKSRENLLALFANAALNKADPEKTLRDAIIRLSIAQETTQTTGIRLAMAGFNRQKAEYAYITRASDAQTANIIKDGGLKTVWSDHTIHNNSGLEAELNRIDSRRTNYTPPKGTRLGGIAAP